MNHRLAFVILMIISVVLAGHMHAQTININTTGNISHNIIRGGESVREGNEWRLG